MAAFLLPVAQRRTDGEFVTPEQVPRGLACDCICPGCSYPVVARQGTEKQWHFAHAKGQACEHGYEVSIHEWAKQLIARHKELLLPELIAVVKGQDP